MEMSAHERCHPMLIPAFPCQSTGKLTFNPPRALLCRGKHRALKILLRAKKELKSVGKCRHRCLGFGAAEAAPGGRSGRGRRGRGGRRSLPLPTAPGRCLSPPGIPTAGIQPIFPVWLLDLCLSLPWSCFGYCQGEDEEEEREKEEEEEGEEYFGQTLRSANSRLYSPSAVGPGPPSSAIPPTVDFS